MMRDESTAPRSANHVYRAVFENLKETDQKNTIDISGGRISLLLRFMKISRDFLEVFPLVMEDINTKVFLDNKLGSFLDYTLYW
jgi:hypothetical protein